MPKNTQSYIFQSSQPNMTIKTKYLLIKHSGNRSNLALN